MARNRLFDDDVLVIGLGRFGSAVALELTKLGHRVIAVERGRELPGIPSEHERGPAPRRGANHAEPATTDLDALIGRIDTALGDDGHLL